MWQEIIEHLSLLCGETLKNPQTTAVGGGSINQTYQLKVSGYQVFVKLNAAPKIGLFEAEVAALKEIARTQAIAVPEPIGWGVSNAHAYLILEWMDLTGAPHWDNLATQLARLHRVQSTQGFGWVQSNMIGETAQPNPWTTRWADFFWYQRLHHQLQLADRRGFSLPVSPEQLQAAVYALLREHSPQPTLVHGDLWRGNVGFDREGAPIIFDPALYYGDREVDIAMTELFGGFSHQFYHHYQQVYPLPEGYESRKTLYNLYHILNHFNLFGGGYGMQAQRMIRELTN